MTKTLLVEADEPQITVGSSPKVADSPDEQTKKKKKKPYKKPEWLENKVFSYGAGVPVTNAELFDEQLHLGHRFKNELVSVELERRKRVETEIAALPGSSKLNLLNDEIKTKAAAIEELRTKKKALNSKSRSKKTIDKELNGAIRSLASELKSLRSSAKELKKEIYASKEFKAGEEARNTWRNKENVQKYGNTGLASWGTAVRLQNEAKKLCSGHPPKFKRWKGDGKVAVQLQTKNSVTEVLAGASTYLRICPVDGGIWVAGSGRHAPYDPNELTTVSVTDPVTKIATKKQITRGEQLHLDADGRPMRYLGDTWVEMRIDSSGRAPVWCKFPIRMHRALPPGSKIKWAWLQRRKVGRRSEWSFQVVLAEDARAQAPDLRLATGGHVAIDVGWRLMPDPTSVCGFRSKDSVELVHASDCKRNGLRSAYWYGSDGQEGEIRLPARWLCAFLKVRDIQSISDKHFNAVRTGITDYIKSQTSLPQWLIDETLHVHNWKSPGRMVRLMRAWQGRRFAGDEAGYSLLTDWYFGKNGKHGERHLYDYMSHLRQQVYNQRQIIYREAVAMLRRSYATVIIEDIRLDELAKRKEPEESHLEKDAAREYRNAACVSSLFGYFKEKMKVVKVTAAGTSYTCNACGAKSFCGKHELMLTCDVCDRTVDRDANASRNIMDAGLNRRPADAAD